ncbi:tetratricopeptide repeat protein [Devosia sp. A16]|uniref:tetratricopeptide repeat protein n=1 Tax=Devosia sp. A16 TaxID=1736675 RepID=UPI000A70BD15|nr:tetratricopeptide repeat protein [Devosia sp. A16]
MGEPLSQSMPPRAEVEAALARIQEWPGLARSPQLARFLNYIVTARLNGNETAIKAYAIAVDVFGRPQSFDPQSDPIVRVQARRLRAVLEEYYAAEGASERVRFYLPVGRYIPEFRVPADEATTPAGESAAMGAGASAVPAPPGERSWLARLDDIVLVVVLVFVALGIAIVMTQVLAPRQVRVTVPTPPAVSVSEFTSMTAGGAPNPGVAGLAVELVTDLGLFPFIDAVYLQRNGQTAHAADFELSGISRVEGPQMQITASLKRSGSDTAVWSMTQKIAAADFPTSIDALSRAFADQLGALDGPLHSEALQWLATHVDLAGNETEYLCGLLFTRYRGSGRPDDEERARGCVNGLLRRLPDSPFALAMSSTLLLDVTRRTQPPSARDPEPIAQAERQVEEALTLAPTSSLVWREYAFFLEQVGRVGEAEAAFTSALQLNPANVDAYAGYARLLSLRGKSEKGERMAGDALRRAMAPPYWYHEAPAVNALRDGNYAEALIQAEALAAGDAELASAIAVTAARRLGSEDALNRSIAQLLEVTRFRRFGILPVLRQRLGDPELRGEIGNALAAAGVEQAALNGPY